MIGIEYASGATILGGQPTPTPGGLEAVVELEGIKVDCEALGGQFFQVSVSCPRD